MIIKPLSKLAIKMVRRNKGDPMKMDTPGIYRIKVHGNVDTEWAERLGGLAVTSVDEENDTIKTTLQGRVQDQAALAGLLIALYESHLPLLQVECITSLAA